MLINNVFPNSEGDSVTSSRGSGFLKEGPGGPSTLLPETMTKWTIRVSHNIRIRSQESLVLVKFVGFFFK